MADLPSPPPVGADDARNAGMSWRRASGSRFEWISPSPSPVVVAELERLYPDIVQVPVQSLEEEEARWHNQSILVRCLSRWIPPEAILREFQRAGIQGSIESVTLANRHFLFRFSDPLAMETALGRPWVVNGQPVAVAQWQPDFVPAASSLNSALLWIRLPQLPIEYWSEEVLSSIIAVAGDYLYSDAATRERNRGGFARVCARVDLLKPFRPGARVRGSRAPFWQQFSYENLDGFCCSCGTLHLDGSCGVPQAPSSSSASPVASGFGPWLSALRRRKSPPTAQPSPSKQRPEAYPVPPSSASPDGWLSPKKVSRRAAGRESSGPSDQLPCRGKEAVLSPLGVNPSACRLDSVPVGKGLLVQLSESESVVQTSKAPGTETPIKMDSNPFSCLDLAPTDGIGPELLKSRVTGHSGPAKRARPVEALSQRVPSKPNKSKGKDVQKGKGGKQANFIFSASSVTPQGSGSTSGPGSKKSRCKGGSSMGSLVESTSPPLTAVMDHDSAVSLLKNVILPEASDMAMDLAQEECLGAGGCSSSEIGCSPASSDSIILEMSGDMDDVPPTLPTE